MYSELVSRYSTHIFLIVSIPGRVRGIINGMYLNKGERAMVCRVCTDVYFESLRLESNCKEK